MKNWIPTTILLTFFVHQTNAQWLEKGYELVPNITNDWIEALKTVDNQTVWANLTRPGNYSGDEKTPTSVVRTNDGGTTWKVFELPESFGLRATGLSATDADHVWVSLRHPTKKRMCKIVHTADGGKNWETILQDSAAGFIVHFFDEMHGIVYRRSYNMKITSDGGKTWHLPASVPTAFPQSIFFVAGEIYDVVGHTIWIPLGNGTILKSTDRGENWSLLVTPLNLPISLLSFTDENNGMATAMSKATGTDYFAALNVSRVIRTTDGGQTWTEIPSIKLPGMNENRYFTRALEGIPGTSGTFLLGIENKHLPKIGYEIYITHDHGDSWDLYSDCPKTGFPIQSFDFLSPTIGWGGTGKASSSESPYFFKFTDEVFLPTANFRVDLGNLEASPQGVHFVCDADGWKTDAHPMKYIDGNVWETTIPCPAGSTMKYKFINGNAWGQNESVLGGCGVLNSAGSFDREITMPNDCRSKRLATIQFGSCLPPGDPAPQTNTACDPNEYLICENFDAYPMGKIGRQAEIWTDLSAPSGSECNLGVTSFWEGFANFSGGRAVRVGGENYGGDLLLGNRTAGKYEISAKIYIPKGNPGGGQFEIGDNLWWQFVFKTDGTMFLTRDFSTNEAAGFTFEFDKWLDLRFIFDLDEQRREFWLDGKLIVNVQDSLFFGSLDRLSFYNFGGAIGYFADDVTMKNLSENRPKAAAIPQKTAQRTEDNFSKTDIFQVYPNPAANVVFVRYQIDNQSVGEISLVNNLGKLLQSRPLPPAKTGSEQFDLNGLPPGVYFLKMTSGKQIWARQVVKF